MSENEKIQINGKTLQVGVLSDDKGYQLYVYPGMTVAEMAFNTMVMERLLEQGKYCTRKEFEKLVDKYYKDPQYAPLDDGDENEKH